MTLRALIADDEPLACERLRHLLSVDAEIDLAGECRNGREVVAALRDQSIDILFLDIQMPATGGFEVIEQIGAANMPVTVFVSAHNHYALRAFEVHALDYLTKPVEPERLQATLAHIKERIASKMALAAHEQMKAVLEVLKSGPPQQKTFAKRLLVHNGTKDLLIAVGDIEWIEAADYYSCLHVGTKSYLLREPIKQLAVTLDSTKFVRVHRSAIVNLDHVREILREGQTEGSIILHNGQRLKMSKLGWQNLLTASRG
jgi:two-component system, LytTR family, response regulator